jgi:endonuclease/exonuclease/phosphatase family metal-dependent hydrolase
MALPLHLAAWNLNHRTRRKSIPPAVLHAIARLEIDILVLTEYVDGDHQAEFKNGLKDLGFESVAVSLRAPQQNQVLMASRARMEDDKLLATPGYTEAAATNWLHRRIPSLGLEVVGFRAPVYLDAEDRAGYWNQVETIMLAAIARPVLFVGDFNCDPFADTRHSALAFKRLTQRDGFSLPNPAGEWSYRRRDGSATSRIDHALASPGVRLTDTRYLYRAGQHVLAGVGEAAPLSDHALLSIRIDRPSALPPPPASRLRAQPSRIFNGTVIELA